MGNLSFWLIITVSSATISCTSVIAGSDHTWDVLIFTQSWPNTECIKWKEQVKQHSCILPAIKNTWTVHGIWPTKLGSFGPFFCNHTLHFDPAKLEPIKDQLEKYWLDIHNGSISALWKHEWQKHGTCAASLPALDSEVNYFGQGLTWITEYNMENILGRAGINPDAKGYTAEQVWDAVNGALGKTLSVHCAQDTETGEWFLYQIRICFDKNLTLIDCDGVKANGGIKTNCPTQNLILYPGNVPGDKHFQQKEVQEPYRARWLLTVLRVIQWLQWVTL